MKKSHSFRWSNFRQIGYQFSTQIDITPNYVAIWRDGQPLMFISGFVWGQVMMGLPTPNRMVVVLYKSCELSKPDCVIASIFKGI